MAKALAVRLDASRYLGSCWFDLPVWSGLLAMDLLGLMESTMTPQEIRDTFTDARRQVLSEAEMDRLNARILIELTGQIAELVGELREIKSDMKRVDEQLFGGKT